LRGGAGAYPERMRAALSLLADVCCVLAFVVIGQALRVLAGQGTAPAFIVVSLLFLGLFLLGWRVAARRVLRASGRA